MTSNAFHVCRGVFVPIALAAVVFGLYAAWAPGASAEELRTWSDATGKFKIKAKFVELSDGKVTLEKENGAQVVIPLEKLSPADQAAAKSLQSNVEDPFKEVKPAPSNPFKEKSPGKSGSDHGTADVSGGEAKIVKPDWSDVKQVLLMPAETKWAVPIDAPKQPAAGKKRPIALPPKSDFFEHVKGLVINPICRRAVIEYALERPGPGGDGQLRIFLCDLEQGKLLSSIKAQGKVLPLALSDAGTEVLMRRDEWGWGNQDRLEIWRLSDSGIQKVMQWIPHEDRNGGERDIKWARFFGEDKLVTESGGGRLTAWDVAGTKPLYWLQIAGGCVPALSPDRKYLAFATDNEIGVLDLAAGEVIALEPAPKEHFANPVFAFTPKGTRLACGSGDRVFVFDVATGALYREISLSGANVHAGEHVLCPNEEHVLVGNSLLVDMESQARLWTYRGPELITMLDGLCWMEVAGKDTSVLLPTVLPQPSAVETIQKMLDSGELFVLKPGVTVKLNVAAIEDPGERKKAAAAFTKQIEANGCQVGANGTIELVASTEMGKRREIAYRTFGQPFGREYTFQEYFCHVKLMYNGKAAWEASCGNTPGMVRLKEGETMEQFLKRHEHPPYEWLGKVELPKLVQKPSAGGGAFGATEVTVSGLR